MKERAKVKKGFKTGQEGIVCFIVYLVTHVVVSIVAAIISFMTAMVLAIGGTAVGVGPMLMIRGMGAEDPQSFDAIFMGKLTNVTPGQATITAIMAMVISIIILKVRHKKMSVEAELNQINIRTIPILCLIGISLSICISAILIGLLNTSSLKGAFSYTTVTGVTRSESSLITMVVIIPIVQEIFCRGLLFSCIRKNMTITKAIILQAFLFTLLCVNPVGVLCIDAKLVGVLYSVALTMVLKMILGIVLGVIAYKQKSIIGTIVVYATFNLTVLLINVFQVQINNDSIYYIVESVSAVIFGSAMALLLRGK